MKKTLLGVFIVGLILIMSGMAQATLLFSDNFNSPDSGDVNAGVAYAGRQGGTIGTMTYSVGPNGWGWNGANQIDSNALKIVYCNVLTGNHNFTDQAIINAGGFVLEFDGKGDSGSFGLGKNMTNNGGEAGVSWSKENANGFTVGTSFSSSNQYTTFPSGGDQWHHFKITLATASFQYGNSATMSLTVDGTPIDMSSDAGFQSQRSFTWGESDLNYFVFGINLPYNDSMFDNIVVKTVPEPTTMLLLGLGLMGLAGVRRKFKK